MQKRSPSAKRNCGARPRTHLPRSKCFFFGFGTVGSFAGLLFILPRLAASMSSIRGAAPVESVGQDLAINVIAGLFFGFLTKTEIDNESALEKRMMEGALISRLPVELQAAKELQVKLGDFRTSKGGRPRRIVLCVGSPEYCHTCVNSSAPSGNALANADLLIVLVPVTAALLPDATAVAELENAVGGLEHVALPRIFTAAEDWEELCKNEFERVQEQGMDAGRGLSIVVGKDGRVGMRMLGSPVWDGLAKEASKAKQLGSKI